MMRRSLPRHRTSIQKDGHDSQTSPDCDILWIFHSGKCLWQENTGEHHQRTDKERANSIFNKDPPTIIGMM
eukprot:scaffold296_cov102-Amphora_coffeaeformis.AAC.6